MNKKKITNIMFYSILILPILFTFLVLFFHDLCFILRDKKISTNFCQIDQIILCNYIKMNKYGKVNRN